MAKKKGKTVRKAASRAKKAKTKVLDPAADFDQPVRKEVSSDGKQKRAPRQSRLAGMEDSAIKDLEEAAIEHSEIRSEIVASRARLHDSEQTISTLMKANGKKSYNHNGIRLKLREGHDSVSVQVKRHDREDKVPESPNQGDVGEAGQ
jgi:hypothetical protein